eukprot:Clim_evm66s142 gene=Clim_evmTU66s142
MAESMSLQDAAELLFHKIVDVVPAADNMKVYFEDTMFAEPIFHVMVEASLALLVIYLLFAKPYSPPKPKGSGLTREEEEELIREWKPEPLAMEEHNEIVEHPAYQAGLVLEGAADIYAELDGKRCLNLSTYNYLGFSADDELKEIAVETLRKYGVGSCGPRGFYGTIDVHLDLEQRLSEFFGTEESILYSYGFSTIASVIPAYAKRTDIVFADSAVSFPIQRGLIASKAKVKFFKHNDMQDLERLLERQAEADKRNRSKASKTRRFLVVEGVYASTGEICPLPKLVEFRDKYKVRIFLEESHSFGVLGATGRGVTEHFKVPVEKIDCIVAGTESSLGSIGGFATGSSYVIDHQRLSGGGYIFSASLPPMFACTAIRALAIMNDTPEMFGELRLKAREFRSRISKIFGVRVLGSNDVPMIHLALNRSAMNQREDMAIIDKIVTDVRLQHNILISRSRYIASEEMGATIPTIRICLSVKHEDEELHRAADLIGKTITAVLSST